MFLHECQEFFWLLKRTYHVTERKELPPPAALRCTDAFHERLLEFFVGHVNQARDTPARATDHHSPFQHLCDIKDFTIETELEQNPITDDGSIIRGIHSFFSTALAIRSARNALATTITHHQPENSGGSVVPIKTERTIELVHKTITARKIRRNSFMIIPLVYW